ncbi:type II toxin-antitoxin system RelE/ParE family toxin [Frateuria aurantia]|uniref:Putative addiction module killer protein n=1 Tax=Frateuria aurantia (strain ATCC 33424 / DSM 6220 / KCTC 2777 / LMG 1558 / NBRC 3245 / NCIMB 13370) TaxID=767434 RepID=H8L2I2_FRAAD|nr:type II toxin-antitoxin system RelE/ParE family toxin [Frateuria aurantia]AFC85449.1 putative addiction module killer protein [Frateuria aurantia DSM 6220]
MNYIVKQTDGFRSWIASVKDLKAKIAVARRIERASQGNFGDHKPVGDGVSELRIPTGPGYRVYYTIRNLQIVILLCGGDKSSQSADINKAKQLAKEIQNDHETD